MVISGHGDDQDDVDLDQGLTTTVEILMDLDGTFGAFACSKSLSTSRNFEQHRLCDW